MSDLSDILLLESLSARFHAVTIKTSFCMPFSGDCHFLFEPIQRQPFSCEQLFSVTSKTKLTQGVTRPRISVKNKVLYPVWGRGGLGIDWSGCNACFLKLLRKYTILRDPKVYTLFTTRPLHEMNNNNDRNTVVSSTQQDNNYT